MRKLPHQQQLQLTDCANGLWKFWLPLEHVATDEQSGALDGRAVVWRSELLTVP